MIFSHCIYGLVFKNPVMNLDMKIRIKIEVKCH